MAESPGIIRFGVFEVNLAAGELRKNGARVKLQEQPFQVLAALLERQGEIVTKEELKERLWAGDTFVDFDHSLSTAVNKIREALGDSASSPRFIETVPRRGYRFVGGAATAPRTIPEAAEAGGALLPRRRATWAALAGIVFVALAAFGLSRWRSEPRLPRPSSQPLPLTSLPGREERPALSPDGTRVAFSWAGESGDNVDLYVQLVGTGARLQLTSDPAQDTAPAWSPDGRQIAFERVSSGGRALYLISSLGGPETRVAAVSDFLGQRTPGIAWAPDGKSIFYGEAESAGAPSAIHRFFLETGEKQRLTSPPPESDLRDARPAVSPDGRFVAFDRGGVLFSEIWIMPLEGGQPRQVTAQGQSILGHAWAPDSREIVYSQEGPLGGRLWRVAIDGGEPRLIPEVAGYGQFPTISSAARRLAYEGVEFDVSVWLYPLPAGDSSRTPRSVGASTKPDTDPQISPDGEQIAFSSTRSGGYEVWICGRDGSNLRQLPSLGGASGSPRWSPDGRQIAFDSAPRENWDVYVVDARGGAPRPLTTDEGLDARPSWSRDGKWVYFTSNRDGGFRIWKTSPDGGEAMPVSQGPHDTQPFESTDGRFLYFSRQLQRNELWRLPAEGGEAVPTGLTLPLSGGQGWDVAGDGIYFVEPRETVDHATKWFLRFARFDAPEPVDLMEVPRHWGATPLDIAPDGSWFAYARNEEVGSDLMYLGEFE